MNESDLRGKSAFSLRRRKVIQRTHFFYSKKKRQGKEAVQYMPDSFSVLIILSGFCHVFICGGTHGF